MLPAANEEWEPKIKMIPSYGVSLVENPELIRDIRTTKARTLGLHSELQPVL